MNRRKILAIFELLLAALIWGMAFVVIKDGVESLTPLWHLALRLGIAAIPSFFLILKERKNYRRKGLKQGIILGIFFYFAMATQSVGIQYTTASKAAFLAATYVAFVPVMEFIIFKSKSRKMEWIAAAVCMVGVGLLTLEGSFSIAIGDFLGLMSGVFYAIHMCYIDRCDEDATRLHIMQIVTAMIVAMIAAFILEPFPGIITINAWKGLAYCGIFEVFLGFFFQLSGQKHVSASLSSILLSMECVFTVVLAAIFLRESMTLKMMIGSALILGAALMNSLSRYKR